MPPFQSEAQRRFLWAKHPDIARRWTAEYGSGKELPRHKPKKKRHPLTEAYSKK